MTTRSTPGRPSERYSQAARVLRLYDHLHKNGHLQPTRVAEAHNVSRRTIERDIALLSEVLDTGLVRDVDSEEFVTYRLVRPSRRWATTRWQALAVAVGARMTGFLRGRHFATEVEPLLDQLRSSLRSEHRMEVNTLLGKIHVIQTGQKRYDHSPRHQATLAQMLDGLLTDQPVRLRYLSPRRQTDGEGPRALTVHPLCAVLHRGGLYFVVDVIEPREPRLASRLLLAADRISGATLDTRARRLQPPADFDAEAFFASAFAIWGGEQLQTVRLRIQASYAPYVRERTWHHSQSLTEQPGGDLILELQVGHLMEVQEWVLGMGEFVQVLAPEALRTEVLRRLRAAVAVHARVLDGDHTGPTRAAT